MTHVLHTIFMHKLNNKLCVIIHQFMLALRLHEAVLLLNTMSLNFNNFNVESYNMHQYQEHHNVPFVNLLI